MFSYNGHILLPSLYTCVFILTSDGFPDKCRTLLTRCVFALNAITPMIAPSWIEATQVHIYAYVGTITFGKFFMTFVDYLLMLATARNCLKICKWRLPHQILPTIQTFLKTVAIINQLNFWKFSSLSPRCFSILRRVNASCIALRFTL